MNLIVYDDLTVSLDIMPETLTKLQSIIQNNGYDIKTGPNLFYNEKGPNTNSGGGDIYIDCQPVGESEETTEIITDMGSTYTFKDFLNNPYLKFILFMLLFIIVLYGLKLLLNMFRNGSQKLITLSGV